MERSRHVLRVVLLLLIFVSGGVLARSFLVPKSYGLYGSYRFDNVKEQRDKPVKHHGAASCKGCHPKQWQLREDGEMHLKVSCEVCHGPLAIHADGPKKDVNKKTADMPVDKTFLLCAKCHKKMDGRPAAFPQLVFNEKHTKGEKIEGAVCKPCHDPHSTMFEEEEGGAAEEKKDEPAEEKPEEKKEEPKDEKKGGTP